MNALQKIVSEINKITLEIEEKYPELYRTLNENPITLTVPKKHQESVSIKDLTTYLEDLKILLEEEIKNRKQQP